MHQKATLGSTPWGSVGRRPGRARGPTGSEGRRALALALALAATATALSAGCGAARQAGPGASGPGASDRAPPIGHLERGQASWYGDRFHGKKTASGERFDMRALTAAHRHLPFGARVRVTNLENGRSVVVRINDRGPYGRGRIIDVSKAAAERLGMLRAGVVRVTVEVLTLPARCAKRRTCRRRRRSSGSKTSASGTGPSKRCAA